MPKQSLIWTVLPNGISGDGKALRFSVLVSPRLEPEAAPKLLSSFSDFVAWPRTLARAKFALRIDSTTIPLDASHIDVSIGQPDEATWAALLPARTSVRTSTMRDHRADVVVSYDTVAMNNIVAGIYGELTAKAGTELPSIVDLLDNSKLGAVVAQVKKFDSAFFNKKRNARDVPGMFAAYRDSKFKQFGGPESPLPAFQLFHTPPNEMMSQTVVPAHDERLKVSWLHPAATRMDAAKAVSDLDFHQIIAAMNQYPSLLRRLGLVLDFTVPRTLVPKSANVHLSVNVELPKFSPSREVNLRVNRRLPAQPLTHTVHSATEFAAVSRPAPVDGDLSVSKGLLKLAPQRFALQLQADVDGAGHKLLNFARTLGNHTRSERQVDPISKLARRLGVPALRNAGLMLVHQKRGNALSNAFERNRALNEHIKGMFTSAVAAAPGLFYEDLVRGWRIDIWDKTTARWRSLCERVSDYDINKGAVIWSGLREEGMVRLAVTSSTDGANPDVVFLHEAVTVWNGWSLVAQQPGNAIGTDDTSLRGAAAEVPDGIRLRTTFTPQPGTLPRLRYGRIYALRARAVDLAGNSLAPKPDNYLGDDSAIAAATPYYRFEPVQPPTFALVGTQPKVVAPQRGESMSHVAIRSFNTQFDDPTPAQQKVQRWVVAARTSQREAELHGVLDGTAWGTPQQFVLLASRDAELQQIDFEADPDATGGAIGLPPNTINPQPRSPASDSERNADKQRAVSFAVLPTGATTLPYLPDPLCTRILVRLLNHPLRSANEPIIIPLYPTNTKWPDIAPLLIHVYEAQNEIPRFDDLTRTLLIPTPKAVRATVRISSMLERDSLDFMGVWSWVPAASRTPALRRRAEAGSLWPLTPWRDLEVVHAVQRPLLKPDMDSVVSSRGVGATAVELTVVASCHRGSTDKVEMRASWHDPHDSASSIGPVDQAREAVPFSIKITDPQGYGGIVEHLVPDAKKPNTIAFGSFKLKEGETFPFIHPKVHDFGDTRYRRVEYHLVATSRFREYMPSSVRMSGAPPVQSATDANLKLAGGVRSVWVMNSATPPAPEVLYVVPTFGWTRGLAADGKSTSWRQGGGLRVWLDRPWNTSGYGEMLAVVIPPKGAAVDPNAPPYKNVVTQWGNDPVWSSPYVTGVAPKEGNFPLRRMDPDTEGAWLPPGVPASVALQPPQPFTAQNLKHPHTTLFDQTGRVDVVPHDVFWDADRRLWFCDIEISHGSAYFPFVRLALARYQPSSLPEMHLSNVVLADFCALAPNRWLTVSNVNPTRRGVRVFGPAPELSAGYAEAFAARSESINNGKITVHLPIEIAKSNIIEVWLEKLSIEHGEDFGWRRISTGVESQFVAQAPQNPKRAVTKKSEAARSQDAATTPAGAQAQVVVKSSATAKQKARANQLLAARDFDTLLKESLIETIYEWPALWSGSIDLPSAPTPNARYRVVVAEYEEYLADGPNPYDENFAATTRRLVFVEHVELT